MIHKINEPKFEPEMHDSRSQTGKRPPPVHHSQQSKSPTNISDNRHSLTPQSLAANRSLPSFVQPYSQHLAGQPVNPFSRTAERVTENGNLDNHSQMMMSQDTMQLPAGRLSKTDNNVSR